MPVDLPHVLDALRSELEQARGLVAVGVFGSAVRGDTWERSDVDLFAITDGEEERWEGVNLRRGGVLVHLQVLSLPSLRKAVADRSGGPFFDALSEVKVWFDRTGDLSKALSKARSLAPPATLRRACRELCQGVADLHVAERHLVAGEEHEARVALAQALRGLAAASLAKRGIYPPRGTWEHPEVASFPEHRDLQALWSMQPLAPLVQGAWERVRARLREETAPIVDCLRESGPLTVEALGQEPKLAKVALTERLIAEMLEAGLIREGCVPYEGFGADQLVYSAV